MMIDLVKRPILTEKSVRLIENNQYTFDVDTKLTKPQIKKFVESVFNVDIVGVNTHIPPRRKRRLGTFEGYKKQYKRVIITIKSGQTIKLIPDQE